MSRRTVFGMRPQDVVVLLKIRLEEGKPWTQVSIASALAMSQSEISESISRSLYARLLFDRGRMVARQPLMDFIQYGLPFAFPQQPGSIVRGIPTAHSAPPLNDFIRSEEHYVWPYAKGSVRGHGIQPLYHSVLKTIESDPALYQLLALIDAVRVGKAREKNIAIDLLRKSIL